MKTSAHIKTYTQMFITALFQIATKRRQLSEWTKCGLYIHSMEYYLTIKNEVQISATTWKSIENTALSERSQPQNGTYY